MRLTIAMLSSALLAGQVAVAADLKYDTNYDYSTNLPLTSFACSDGANGLITKTGAQNLVQLKAKLQPNTFVAAGPSVAGWNSPNCGQCWQAKNSKGTTLKFVLVDYGSPSRVTGTEAFKKLSPSGTTSEGVISVTFTELPRQSCFK